MAASGADLASILRALPSLAEKRSSALSLKNLPDVFNDKRKSAANGSSATEAPKAPMLFIPFFPFR